MLFVNNKTWHLVKRSIWWSLIIIMAIIFLLIIQGHHGLGNTQTFEKPDPSTDSSID